nr:MAG TPA: hypothetical protein [Caudoviricetes sp.]
MLTIKPLAVILSPSAGRTTHQEGEALKNIALKKRSVQSRKLWESVSWSLGLATYGPD